MLGSSRSSGERSASPFGNASTFKPQGFQTCEKSMSMKIPRHIRKQDNVTGSLRNPEGAATKVRDRFASWAS